jgi:hypothetical protein
MPSEGQFIEWDLRDAAIVPAPAINSGRAGCEKQPYWKQQPY